MVGTLTTSIDHVSGTPIGDTRISRVWTNRLTEADTFTRGHIRQWCNSIVPLSVWGRGGGFRSNMTPNEALELVRLFKRQVSEHGGYRLTNEHDRYGREWLRKHLRDIERRDGANGVVPHDFTIDAMEPRDTFRFVGWEGAAYGARFSVNAFVPVYAVRYVTPNGHDRRWRYWWTPWQAGAYS